MPQKLLQNYRKQCTFSSTAETKFIWRGFMSAALCSHLFQVEETKKAQEELKQRAKEARQQMRDLEKDPCDADCDSAL